VDVKFDGDYDAIVTDKKQFLDDCSQTLDPVRCVDVRKGSIIVTIEHENTALVTNTHQNLDNQGLVMEGYPKLQTTAALSQNKDEGLSAGATVAIVLVCIFVLVCAIGAYLLYEFWDDEAKETKATHIDVEESLPKKDVVTQSVEMTPDSPEIVDEFDEPKRNTKPKPANETQKWKPGELMVNENDAGVPKDRITSI